MLLGKWIFVKFLLSKRRKKDEKYGFVADVFQLSKLAEISSPQSKAMACSLIESFVAFFFFFFLKNVSHLLDLKTPPLFQVSASLSFCCEQLFLAQKAEGPGFSGCPRDTNPKATDLQTRDCSRTEMIDSFHKAETEPLAYSFIHSFFVSFFLSFFLSFLLFFFLSLSLSISLSLAQTLNRVRRCC